MYYIAHHGIKGQKWGTRNGPPYPLNSSEKKAGWRSSLGGKSSGGGGTSSSVSMGRSSKKSGLTDEQKKKIVKTGAVVLGVAVGAVAAYELGRYKSIQGRAARAVAQKSLNQIKSESLKIISDSNYSEKVAKIQSSIKESNRSEYKNLVKSAWKEDRSNQISNIKKGLGSAYDKAFKNQGAQTDMIERYAASNNLDISNINRNSLTEFQELAGSALDKIKNRKA